MDGSRTLKNFWKIQFEYCYILWLYVWILSAVSYLPNRFLNCFVSVTFLILVLTGVPLSVILCTKPLLRNRSPGNWSPAASSKTAAFFLCLYFFLFPIDKIS